MKKLTVPVVPGRTAYITDLGTEIDLTQFMVQSDYPGAPCAACGIPSSVFDNQLTWSLLGSLRLVLCDDFRACNERTGGYHQDEIFRLADTI